MHYLKTKLNLNSKFVLYLLLYNCLLIIANIPFLLRITRFPNNTVLPLAHSDWVHDYYLYLSAITQGIHGQWLFHDPYTAEKTTPGFFYIFFTLIGKIGSIFSLTAPIIYHLTIIIFSEVFFLLLWVLSGMILGRKNANIGVIFSVLGNTAPLSFYLLQRPSPIRYAWWTELASLERLYIYPHYIASQTLFILAVIFTIKYILHGINKYAYAAAITIFAGGIILPSVLYPIALSLPTALLIFYIRNRTYKISRFLFGTYIILTSIIIGFILVKLQTMQGFPWSAWSSWGIARWNKMEPLFNRDLMLSFGILPLIALPSVIYILIKGKSDKLFMVLWALSPFIMLPFVDLFGIPKYRLIQIAPFVPFGLLSAYTYLNLIPRKNRQISQIILLAIFLISVIPVSYTMLKNRISLIQKEKFYEYVYVKKTSNDAVDFIDRNIPINSVFISDAYMDLIIPAFAPMISFSGHMTMTVDFGKKAPQMTYFYSGKMTEKQAKDFLTQNNINYVYYGSFEKKRSNDKFYYPFLKTVYENPEVKIFKVN